MPQALNSRLLLFWSLMVAAIQKILVSNPRNVQCSCFRFHSTSSPTELIQNAIQRNETKRLSD